MTARLKHNSDLELIVKAAGKNPPYTPSEAMRAIEKITETTAGDYHSDLIAIAAVALHALQVVGASVRGRKDALNVAAKPGDPDRESTTGRFAKRKKS